MLLFLFCIFRAVFSGSEVGDFAGFELKLQFIRDQGDKLTVGGFPLGIADRVSEEALEGIQIPAIPGHLDGVADGPLDS